jgi:hypothetical protein
LRTTLVELGIDPRVASEDDCRRVVGELDDDVREIAIKMGLEAEGLMAAVAHKILSPRRTIGGA